MELDTDLQRILNVGAKIYHTLSKKQGKVYSNNGIDIIVDYGKGNKYETYSIEDFSDLLISDTIVANSRVTLAGGDKEEFRIKPREISTLNRALDVILGSESIRESESEPNIQRPLQSESTLAVKPTVEPVEKLTEGYINFTTQKFSTEPKKGYTKVVYKKAVEKITVEVDSEMLEKLREMGLV